jgi:hypothetical protein
VNLFTRVCGLLCLSASYLDCVEQYKDDEGDRVLLATDSDFVAAIEHARSAGWKVFSLYFFVISNLIASRIICILASYAVAEQFYTICLFFLQRK